MSDQPVTREKLINADKDVQVIEDFIKKSKDETVTTRFGDEIMTLKGLEEEVKKSGGYFKRYTSLAAANADIANIPVNGVVKVTNAVDGGDYEKVSAEATTLTKSAHDPLTQAKSYTNEKTEFWDVDDIKIIKFDDFSEYSVGFVGGNLKAPLLIKKNGEVVSEKFNANEAKILSLDVASNLITVLDEFTGYSFGVGGKNGKYPLLFDLLGTVVVDRLKVAFIEAVNTGLIKVGDGSVTATNEFDFVSWLVKGVNGKSPLFVDTLGTTNADKIKTSAINDIDAHQYATTAVVKEAVQEWWIYPVHQYLDYPYPRVVSGLYSELGEILVCEYVLGTSTTKRIPIAKTPAVDDHNAPAIWMKENRRTIVTWTRHANSTFIELKVSDKTGDIRSLEYAETLRLEVGSAVTYTQIHHISSTENEDTFWLFCRTRGTLEWQIVMFRVGQNSGAVTLDKVSDFITAPEQYYMSSVSDENTIRIASGYNPAATNNRIHYWEIDKTTGDVKDHTGTVVANVLTDTNMPINTTTATPVLPDTAWSVDRRLFYVRSAPMSPAIAYAEWTKADGADGVYKIASLEDGQWVIRDVAPAGSSFGYIGSASYLSGISFPEPCYSDEVLISRYDDAKQQGVLARALLVDDTYRVKETLRSSERLLRPISPIDGGNLCMYIQLHKYGSPTNNFYFESTIKSAVME